MSNPALERLRLLVETTPPNGLVNEVQNPDGRLGGWGWVSTRETSLANQANIDTDPAGLRITWPSSSAGDPVHSEPFPVAPGEWLNGRITVVESTNAVVGHWLLFDDEGALLEAAAYTPLRTTVDPLPHTGYMTAHQVPAGVAYAALRLNRAGTGTTLVVDEVMVTRSTGTASLGTTFGFSEPFVGVDILGSAYALKIDRAPLNAGTLEGSIYDLDLDPAVSEDLRPGRRLRLEVEESPGTWSPLFVGAVAEAEVTYRLKRYAADDPRHADIALTAVDHASRLAAAQRPDGVSSVAHLPWSLEGAGVPWDCNGNTGHRRGVTIVSRNDEATALDQVAITRDSVHGHAWVDRAGVLRVYDPANMPAGVVEVLDEQHYTDLDAGWDTASIINEVEVTVVYLTGKGETKEKTYGPFRDAASVGRWGPRRSTFRVHGIANSKTAARTYALEVMAANAAPAVRVREVTLPVRNDAEIPHALVDLYDLVQVVNTGKGLDHQRRVTKLEQTITPAAWEVALEFEEPTAVASPQATPSVPDAAVALEVAGPVTTVQGGQTTINLNGNTSNNKSITFPRAFDSAPDLVCTGDDGRYIPVVVSVSATGATLQAAHRDGQGLAISVLTRWIAVGPITP